MKGGRAAISATRPEGGSHDAQSAQPQSINFGAHRRLGQSKSRVHAVADHCPRLCVLVSAPGPQRSRDETRVDFDELVAGAQRLRGEPEDRTASGIDMQQALRAGELPAHRPVDHPAAAPDSTALRLRRTADAIGALEYSSSLWHDVEVGRIITEELHGGDLSAYGCRARKPVSLRALAESLPAHRRLSPPRLSRAARAYALLALAGISVAALQHLGRNHIREISSAPADTRIELLLRAESRSWSTRRIAAEVRALRATCTPTGPSSPARRGERTAETIERLAELASDDRNFCDVHELSSSDPRALRRLVAALNVVIDRCEETREPLHRRATPHSGSRARLRDI